MYNHNRSCGTCLYSDYMIYSPKVPVLRDDRGALLDTAYAASFVTSPAVNAGAVERNEPHNVRFIETTMSARVDRVLWVMCQEGHSTLLLGAWGCGVFRNDPSMVARLFFNALRTTFAGRFARVVFAVLDTRADERIIGPFRRHGQLPLQVSGVTSPAHPELWAGTRSKNRLGRRQGIDEG